MSDHLVLISGGRWPSSSVKPYSRAKRLDQNDPPDFSMMAGSDASATTALPLNLGVSPKLMSRPWSVRVPSGATSA